MPNPVFPTIKNPSYVYDESAEDCGISSEMDDGSVLSRAKFTRSRMTFNLSWTAMPAADKGTLMGFYKSTVKGSSLILDWTHPDPTSEYYNNVFHVRITDISFKKSTHDRWAVSLTLQEA